MANASLGSGDNYNTRENGRNSADSLNSLETGSNLSHMMQRNSSGGGGGLGSLQDIAASSSSASTRLPHQDADSSSTIFSTPPHTTTGTPLESPELPEKVRHFTSELCAEFKRLMEIYGDKVVENLTPMTIEVLEQLQEVITVNQRWMDEIDMLREDKQQLITQYEREKQARRQSEQRLMTLEDDTAVVENESQKKIEELESVVRVLELRTKNEADHATRLEERETEVKKDYQKLHDKYTELWRAHAEQLERTKILLGPNTEELLTKTRSGSLREARAMLLECAKENVVLGDGTGGAVSATLSHRSGQYSSQSSVNASVERSMLSSSHHQPNPALNDSNNSNDGNHTPTASTSGEVIEELTFDEEIASRSMEDLTNEERKFDETGDSGTLEISESYDAGEGPMLDASGSLRAEIEEGLSLPSLGSAMSREIDNLIGENKELLDTKNALNVVKNDLLTQVEDLLSENAMLKNETLSLKVTRDKYKQRLQESEEKFRVTRDGYEQKLKEIYKSEEDVPYADQKRFTRGEMSRIVTDRNRCKEQLVELQEQLRWHEANAAGSKIINLPPPNVGERGGIWVYFKKLLVGSGGTMPTSSSSLTLSSAAAGGSPSRGVRSAQQQPRRSSAYNNALSSAAAASTTTSSSPKAFSRARGSDLSTGSSKYAQFTR